MKRIVLLAVAALMFAPAIHAQVLPGSMPFKVDKSALLKEIERSDKTLENEKRASRGQTWLDRGEVFYKTASVILSQVYPGMKEAELREKLAKDAQTSQKTMPSNETYTVISVPEVDFYLQEGEVRFWEMKQTVYDGAVGKAFEAYKKAAELDPKLAPKAKEGLIKVADLYKMEATTLYNLGRNIPAADLYLKAYEVQAEPLVNVLDSNAVYNAGYLYVMDKNYDKTIEIYEAAIAKDVWAGGNIAYFLSWAYLQIQEYPKAKAVLQRAIKLYPDNKNITEGLINYYSLAQDDFSEIKEVLEKALAEDRGNIVLWNGLGQAHIKRDNRQEAIKFFGDFVAQFPNDFGANYYLGDQWMEEGEALLKEAEEDTSMSQAQRDEKIAKAMEAFRSGLAPAEKAYEMRSEEKAALQRVIRILFRLKDEPGMQPQFDRYNKIYEAEVASENA